MHTVPISESTYRPTRAHIDCAALARNIQIVAAHSKARVMAVIKADAYGHGATPCARVLEKTGAAYLGVALAEEALALRRDGIRLPILVLGRAPFAAFPALVAQSITCTVTCKEDAEAIDLAAAQQGGRAAVHIKVDTGMSRLGIQPWEVDAFWNTAANCSHLFIEGIFTHFASADAEDLAFSRTQAHIFADILNLLSTKNLRPPLAHACASAALHTLPEAVHDMVRPGVCLYGGINPNCTAFSVEPVMRLETEIIALRTFEPGRTISYGNTYTCDTARRIAVLPLGYADGAPRALSNRGRVSIAGRSAPIVGRVCMDMLMVDVTTIPQAAVGSQAILFGNPEQDGPDCPTINEIAECVNTIPYEIMCGIGQRVPRSYA